MVKTVANLVTVAHNHTLASVFSPRSLVDIHNFSLMDGDGQFVIRGTSKASADNRSSFETIPVEMLRPKRSPGDLLDLSFTETVCASQHCQDGLQVGTEAAGGNPVGQTGSQVVSPQCSHAKRWRRYSVMMGSIFGSSAV